jgi:hypothetical protein
MPQAAEASPPFIFLPVTQSEPAVSGLVLVTLLIFATLVVLLWGGGGWLQGFIYSEPTTQLFWRAPAAGALLAGWFLFWASTEYRAYVDEREPSRYGAVFQFSATDERRFDEFWSKEGDRKVLYNRRTVSQGRGPGRPVFISERAPHLPWSGSEEIILKEGGKEVPYKLDRSLTDRARDKKESGGARYRNDAGTVITEDMIRIGRIPSFRWKTFLTYALLNVGFLVLWFVTLWLLMRFQWSHALGLAFVFWLVSIIFVVPPLVERADTVAEKKATPVAASSLLPSRL